MLRTLFWIPIPFTDKSIPVYAYGFMLMIGFLVALYAVRVRASREGLESENISDLGIYLIFSGIGGGRLFYVVQNFDLYKHNLLDIIKIHHGGLVFYGGLLAASITLVVIVMVRKLPVLLTFDIIAPSLALGLCFGRIGCFLNGCCWGDVCDPDLWWAVSFPKSVDLSNMIDGSPAFVDHLEKGLISVSDSHSLPIHPTQIYSSLGNLAIFFMSTAFFKYRKRDGEVVIVFCLLYSVLRFCMEIMRDDNPLLFDGLTISQNISILVFVVMAALIIIGRLKLRADHK
ncbi:MAG: prolipoprotein diacylglyceryl transferase [Planctomycetes bacterium]|nr:prolipoprotein diacylglyceryl transferase [Planctomycetota bacterium]